MKILKTIFLVMLFLTFQFDIVLADNPSKNQGEMKLKWAIGNYGGDNLGLPLTVKLDNFNLSNRCSIRIKTGVYSYYFDCSESTNTFWIKYQSKTSRIIVEAYSDNKKFAENSILPPTFNVKTNELKLYGLISDEIYSVSTDRVSIVSVKEAQIPRIWHDMLVFSGLIIINNEKLQFEQWNAVKNFARIGGEIIIIENVSEINSILAMFEIASNFEKKPDKHIKYLGQTYKVENLTISYFAGLINKYSFSDVSDLSTKLRILAKMLSTTKVAQMLQVTRNFTSPEELTFLHNSSFAVDDTGKQSIIMITLIVSGLMIFVLVTTRFIRNINEHIIISILILTFLMIGLFLFYVIEEQNYFTTETNIEASSISNSTELQTMDFKIHEYKFLRKCRLEFADSENRLLIPITANYNAIDFRFSKNSIILQAFRPVYIIILDILISQPTIPITLLSQKNSHFIVNQSNSKIENIYYLHNFKGSFVNSCGAYSSTKISKATIPYRHLLKTALKTDSEKLWGLQVEFTNNLIVKNREFITCIITSQKTNKKVIKLVLLD